MATTYEPIATTTLGSNQATFTFSSIPSTFTDLFLVIRGGMATTTGYGLAVRVNGDATNGNYGWVRLYGAGSNSITSDKSSSDTWGLGLIPAPNTQLSMFQLTFHGYKDTSFHKAIQIDSYGAGWNSGGATGIVGTGMAIWKSTSAINQIAVAPEFTANWLSGSSATLYGIKRA